MEIKRKVMLIFSLIFTVIIFSFLLSLLTSNFKKRDLITKLSWLNLKKDTIDLINAQECTELTKFDAELIITGCKDDILVRLILVPEGYVMRVCGGWSDGREVAHKAKNILNTFGITVDCDLDSIVLLGTEDGTEVYDVCGNKLYLKDGCIV